MKAIAGATIGALCAIAACSHGDPKNEGLVLTMSRRDDGSAQRKEVAGPFMVNGHPVIRQEGLGPIDIGEWRRPALSVVYVVHARAGADSTDVLTVRGLGRDTFVVVTARDTVRRIEVDRKGPRTVDGIAVGTSVATLRERKGFRAPAPGDSAWTLAGLCGVSAIVRNSTVARIVISACKR